MRRGRKALSFGSAIFIVAGIIYYLINGNLQTGSVKGLDECVVLAVHDGDTIKVMYEGRAESVRFIGMDAPEIEQEKWGRVAQEKVYSLAPPGSVVRLEFDVTKRDKYNRLLAYVFTRDGKFINEIMLREGLAMLYTFPPNVRYTERFREAQSYAREHRLGIWGEDGLTMTPQEYRKSRKK
ncbi:MAG: thermonuclease family protein [Myxococcota bacterium]